MMNYFNLIFSNNSILRILQMNEFNKLKIKGNCLEFGANHNLKRNFLDNHSTKYKTTFSNINRKNKNFLYLDLQKKTNHKIKYDNIVIFNVLEHLSDIDQPIENLYFLLKKKGNLYGSTPFIYRVHGAPNDYHRFTATFIKKILERKNFTNVKVYPLGLGPFLASISLLRGYLKFIPFINQVLIFISILLDYILNFVMKTNAKQIYPLGYIFIAKKK